MRRIRASLFRPLTSNSTLNSYSLNMILDEGFDKIKKLNIDEHNSEVLSVNNSLWNDEINKYDRKYNLGCVSLVVGTPILMMILPDGIKLWTFLILLMLGFFYKFINTWRCSNLKTHTLFEYEIANDRIVRYDYAKYRIFHFDEIKHVEVKSFGLLLWKRKPFLPFLSLTLLKYTDDELIVVPNQLQSYEQIKVYLLEGIRASQ